MPADRVLTLDESVRLAQNNSQTLLNLHEDEEIALQRVRESEALFFPKLDLNANWSKFRVEGDKPLLLEPTLGPTLITGDPHQNFYTTRANIYQTVYEGGRVRNTWRQARISYERARSAYEAAQAQVAGAGKHAFYDFLQAQEKDRVYAETMKRLQPFFRRPVTVSAETIHLESELSELRAESAQARLEAQNARLAYLRALNLELNTSVALKGDFSTHPVELDLQKMLAWASQYRAELRQTEFQQELDSLGVSLSLAERTPTVGFGASYERSGHDAGLDTADWAGTLNINVPLSISDLFYGWAKVREHKAQYRQAALKHAETEDQIQMQVRDAYNKYRFWQEELTPREDDYRRLQTMVDNFRKTQAKASDRVQAERLLLQARCRYQEAVYGHLSALAALEQAVGRNLTEQ